MEEANAIPTDVSVVIPVGPNHKEYAQEALDSVALQSFVNFEVVVVNDDLEPLPIKRQYDFKLLVIDRFQFGDQDPWGAGKARNIGVLHSNGDGLIFLDADDLLLPGAIQAMWAVYEEHDRKVAVYGDVIRADTHQVHIQGDQYCGDELEKTSLHSPKRMPTYLLPRKAHDYIGGWKPDMPLWEDIYYEIALDAAGLCAVHISYPVYYYRFDTGSRRKQAKIDSMKQAARDTLNNDWREYYSGEKKMNCNSCGSKQREATARRMSDKIRKDAMKAQLPDLENMIRSGAVVDLVYVYPTREKRHFVGRASNKKYEFANGSVERLRRRRIGYGEGEVEPNDALFFLQQVHYNHQLFKIEVVRSAPEKREVEEKTASDVQIRPASKSLPADEKEALRAEVAAIFASRNEGSREQEVVEKVKQEPDPVVESEDDLFIPDDGPESIKEFTVSAMKELVDKTPEGTLRAWLDEEQASDSPRITMVRVLQGALDD